MAPGRAYRVPIVIEPYPDGGFGVRSPVFPELISEGDTFEEAVKNAYDAAMAVLELYQDLGKELPDTIAVAGDVGQSAVGFDIAVAASA